MKKIFLIIFSCLLFFPRGVFATNNDEQSPSRSILVLVAPFKTLNDEISSKDLVDFWTGENSEKANIITARILVTQKIKDDVSAILGSPDFTNIQLVEESTLINETYANNAWAIVRFEDLIPQWKVINIDGISPLEKSFDPNIWPLTTKDYVKTNCSDESIDWNQVPVKNYDPSKMTTLILTGVTALVRATADYMDIQGILYPASLIREPLIDADILHISNEVSFYDPCIRNKSDDDLRFCSKSSFMELLKDIGTDVVELDGDHLQDYGDDAVLHTLKMYQEEGIPYYGGGVNKEEAQKPLILSHNGNKFAFIGCNGKEIGYAAASETRPGTIHCDMELITTQIKALRKAGIIPIMTFQHLEVYKMEPVDAMRKDFEAAANAGAVIVSGSQSHIPMTFDLTADSFIHYGLGNLFFDQAFYSEDTATATIDKHIFYNGKHISTVFLTIQFTNCALSRFMSTDERNTLLTKIFSKSIVELPDEAAND